jgi:hypothetical protein
MQELPITAASPAPTRYLIEGFVHIPPASGQACGRVLRLEKVDANLDGEGATEPHDDVFKNRATGPHATRAVANRKGGELASPPPAARCDRTSKDLTLVILLQASLSNLLLLVVSLKLGRGQRLAQPAIGGLAAGYHAPGQRSGKLPLLPRQHRWSPSGFTCSPASRFHNIRG